MKIVFFPSDLSGCGYYRMLLPAMALEKKGHTIGWSDNDCWTADLIVYQRSARPVILEAIRYLQHLGKKTVIDMDDNLFLLEPDNPAFYAYTREDVRTLEAIIGAVDAVTVSTKPLADSLRRLNSNIHILPNCVDEVLLSKSRRDNGRTVIGWQGGNSHILDLKLIRSAVNTVGARHDFDLVLAGFDPGDIFRRYSFRPWVQLEPTLGFVDSFADFSVGLCPLRGTPFNDCKSDIKFLEYAALAIPTVASKTVVYQTIRHGETSYLARNLGDWERFLTELITDPEKRRQVGARAREYVAEERTIQKNIRRWEEVYANL